MIKEKNYVCFVSLPKHPQASGVREKIMEVESYDIRKIIDMIPEDVYKLYFFKKLHGQEGEVSGIISRIFLTS